MPGINNSIQPLKIIRVRAIPSSHHLSFAQQKLKKNIISEQFNDKILRIITGRQQRAFYEI